MPTTESAIDADELAALILDAIAKRPISPLRFTDQLMYDFQDLEGRARVKTGTAGLDPNNSELQAYMRRSLEVMSSLLDMGFTPENALFWFRCFPIRDLHRQTPMSALSEEHVEHVIKDLERVFGIGNQGFADFFEKMREDTQSIQKDIFNNVKMISADDAARLCRIATEGLSPLDKARAVERTKRVIYLMKGKEPVFPAYQFDYQGPKRIIAWIIRTLSPYRSNWEIAVWLWASNGWLGGASPAERLDSEPILVLDAAFQEIVEEKEASAADSESMFGVSQDRLHPDIYMNELLVGMRELRQVLPLILKKLQEDPLREVKA